MKCECECGNTVFYYKYNITSGKNVSCGCDRPKEKLKTRKDFTGQRFGHLVISEMLFNYGKAEIHGVFVCAIVETPV